ncbi:MAG: hypothetical protein P9L94_01860 [Candidatus Hinthialibacter antarcticus]|nr:hypothetical protein [Candidatus Hinthialibacter antarcticus]
MNTEESVDLYEFEIDRFQSLLAEDSNYAYRRYGLTLFYSLPPEDTFKMKTEMGWKGEEALDYYNQGTVEALEGRYAEALKLFEKSESLKCDRAELYYNIAVIHEEEERAAQAKEYFQKYVDAVESLDFIPKALQDDLDEVREHVKEL